MAGLTGIVCNIILFIAKLVVGFISGSVSIMADAINNLSDASGSIITLLGFRLAEKPADEEHPYGHARIEYLSGLAVAALILLIGGELAKSSFNKILHPEAINFSIALVVVLVLSIAVKLWMALFYYKVGKQINSASLIANATDSRNDVISTAAVLIGCLVGHWFHITIDGYIGLAVALFILWSGFGIAKETIHPLLGESATPEQRQQVEAELTKNPKVLGVHDMMLHDYGPGQRFASAHVEMDAREDPLVCHDIIDNIERIFWQDYRIHMSIHYDPVVTDDEEINQARSRVKEILEEIDPAITMHDFRMVKGPEHSNLIFDLVPPTHLTMTNAELQAHINTKLNTGDHKYYTVITFDAPGFN